MDPRVEAIAKLRNTRQIGRSSNDAEMSKLLLLVETLENFVVIPGTAKQLPKLFDCWVDVVIV